MIEVAACAALIGFIFGYIFGRSNGQRRLDRARVRLLQLAGKSGKLQDVRETALYAAKGLRDDAWNHEAHVRRLETAKGLDRKAEKKN